MGIGYIGYGGFSKPTDDHGGGGLRCWWYRWSIYGEPGTYLLCVDDEFMTGEPYRVQKLHAVVDDFGNLRRVTA